MNRLLKALKARHAIIETRVIEEQRRVNPDTIRLSTLKKIKLQLRDQILSIERIVDDSKAEVVRRFPKRRRTVIG